MDTNKDIHTAVTVATRFNVLHTASTNLRQAISRFRFEAFTDTLTPEQTAILKEAEHIACTVESSTGCHDALRYLETLKTNLITL